jgi:choline dehydrogenase-like flavoprotein
MVDSVHQFDVIVVGAGSSGATLAARLSEDTSRSVLLIEAGKDFGPIENYPAPMRDASLSVFSMPGNPHGWPLKAKLTDDLTYPITRGKLVGGSSAVNGALFMRGHPDDFDNWAADGNAEWSYEKVLPFFRKQETDLDFGETDVHGGSGPIPVGRANREDLTPVSQGFVEACMGLGHVWDLDLNGPGTGGVGLVPNNAPGGIRQNVAVRYLEPAKARSNLTVMAETLVHRVVFRGTVATGVEVSRNGSKEIIEGDEIVLSCGAINTPQILMLSGVGAPNELDSLGIEVVCKSPYVGKNLMDHPGVKLAYRTSKYRPAPGPRAVAEVVGHYQIDGVEVRIYPFLYTRMNQLFGVFRGRGFLKSARSAAAATNPIKAVRGVWGSSLHALRSEVSEREDLSILCSLGVEESRGHLSLASADPTAAPIIEFQYLTNPSDSRRFRQGLRLALEIAQTAEFQRLEPNFTVIPSAREVNDDDALNSWIAHHLGTSYHSAGTCKMGPATDESAVVDQHCRVHGVEGLRVVDISILPTIVRRPTSATAAMLGERAAELICRPSPSKRTPQVEVQSR